MQVVFFTIHDLLLKDFIDIVCDNNLFKIVRKGQPTFEEVVKQWDALFLAYSDSIGCTEYEIELGNEKQLVSLRAKIEVVSAAIKILAHVFVDDLVEWLNQEYCLDIQYYADEKRYYNQFKIIEGQLKNWAVDRDILLLKSPKETVANITRETFDNIKVELSSFMGYPVKDHETTVSEFAIMIKRLKKHNEAVENTMKKAKAA